MLSTQTVEIIFCDEHQPDGAYCDLIYPSHGDHMIPRVVGHYANRRVGSLFPGHDQGSLDVIRAPWYATDVELAVIRALREEDQPFTLRAAVA